VCAPMCVCVCVCVCVCGWVGLVAKEDIVMRIPQ